MALTTEAIVILKRFLSSSLIIFTSSFVLGLNAVTVGDASLSLTNKVKSNAFKALLNAFLIA